MNSSVFVIIPVFNDVTTIRRVCEELIAAGFPTIVIVDDGSTVDIAAQLQFLGVYYLRHQINLGQGAALQTGFRFALERHAQFVVTFDADGQHRAGDVSALLEPVWAGKADIALGSRFLDRKSSSLSWSRMLTLKVGVLVNLLFSGIYLTDAHNGLRALNRKALSLIQLSENRMAHASEILFEIKRHRLKYTEVPVIITYTAYSRSKGQTSLGGIKIFFDIIVHKFLK